MSARDLLQRALALPPRELARRVARRGRRELRELGWRGRDALAGSHADAAELPAGPLTRLVQPLPLETLRPRARELADVCALHLQHRFDLLGSGWVQVRHGLRAAGVEGHVYPPGPAVHADADGAWLAPAVNRANRARSRAIWRLIDDPAYVPIDWHVDFKSGHRWDPTAWGPRTRYGNVPAADVKVPWELSRMQHLPQLACAHALAAGGCDAPGIAPVDAYRAEFRRQVLDFTAANPPRRGVNWCLAMDVAIRAANWAVAYDLFRAHGATFDAAFDRQLAASLLDHGRFVVDFLESDGIRGNHYLANLAGLLVVAAYLPAGAEPDAWLAFARRELVRETAAQFTADGGNFESSTCYHRLATEMVAYATAIGMRVAPARWGSGVTTAPFPAAHFARLARAGELLADAVKPGGRIVQVGDNDSGRFLRLLPIRARIADGAAYCWDEDALRVDDTLGALAALLGRPDLARGAQTAEGALVRGLVADAGQGISSEATPRESAASRWRVGDETVWREAAQRSGDVAGTLHHPAPGARLRDGATLAAYPDFGLYVYRSARLFLSVRCGRRGQIATGGHAHVDELAVELSIDGRDLLVDRGSYLYTALADRRNEYRAGAAHAVPAAVAAWTGHLAERPFQLRGAPVGVCLYWGARGFVGRVTVDGASVVRSVEVRDDAVVVTDRVTAPSGHAAWGAPHLPTLPVSPGYGRRERPSCDDAADA